MFIYRLTEATAMGGKARQTNLSGHLGVAGNIFQWSPLVFIGFGIFLANLIIHGKLPNISVFESVVSSAGLEVFLTGQLSYLGKVNRIYEASHLSVEWNNLVRAYGVIIALWVTNATFLGAIYIGYVCSGAQKRAELASAKKLMMAGQLSERLASPFKVFSYLLLLGIVVAAAFTLQSGHLVLSHQEQSAQRFAARVNLALYYQIFCAGAMQYLLVASLSCRFLSRVQSQEAYFRDMFSRGVKASEKSETTGGTT
jgi:hypothetical protein